ncbi:hypothetical protein CWE12_10165 [Aliidiomarina sedimenti]|uniref:Uncharacterized protein n=1 Tax=Aliidiomarina sedimenti TaxID=1933879 RepID=A0ABY0BY33_9GAMM|nr:type VI secretion system-associated protein TagO [Aliidiomarina sedimenti]RUO29337.1 hypothetical protein CWE12_10165 [Aliidiomarina sedimenti]
MKAWILPLVSVSLLLAIPGVQAQNNEASDAAANAEENSLLMQLQNCRRIDSSVERLDCYDRLARTQQTDEPSRAAARAERAEEARLEAAAQQQSRRDNAQQRRDDFGREHLARPAEDDTRRYITIVDSWQNPRGLWRFRTEEGAEWHQIESVRNFFYESDADYYIERGAMNSFMLSHDGSNRSIRVRRVD